MLKEKTGISRVFIRAGYTDLRMGIDGLAGLIQSTFHLSPFDEGTLFLFCGRSSSRIKGLVWEGDGFLLLYKRFENGRIQWPRNNDELRTINDEQYKWLMQGLSVDPGVRKIFPKKIL